MSELSAQEDSFLSAQEESKSPKTPKSPAMSEEKLEFKRKCDLLFADVGGIALWRKFYKSLDLVGDNFGLPHVLTLDEHVPIGSTLMVKDSSNFLDN